MNSYLTTTQVLLFVGAAQGLVLSFVLFTLRRANRAANRLLAGILSIFSLNIIFHTLSHDNRFIGVPHHEQVVEFTLLLYGVFLYFYVKYLTDKTFILNKRKLLHLLPFTIGLILSIPFYIKSINSEKPHFVLILVSGLGVVSATIYMIIIVKILISHTRKIQDSYSSIEKINLRWLKLLISGFTFTILFGFLLDTFRVMIIGWDYVWLLISLFMYVIGYMGLKQPEIFTRIEEPKQESETPAIKKKYEKSTLTPETANLYFAKLITCMKSEKPYLNSNLTLPELASSMSIPVHHLSQIINERLNQNFFEFINSYRVEEAKKMLVDDVHQNYNILSIGLDAGFNSVSAFNAAFKKLVKMTPSQYRTSNLKQSL